MIFFDVMRNLKQPCRYFAAGLFITFLLQSGYPAAEERKELKVLYFLSI